MNHLQNLSLSLVDNATTWIDKIKDEGPGKVANAIRKSFFWSVGGNNFQKIKEIWRSTQYDTVAEKGKETVTELGHGAIKLLFSYGALSKLLGKVYILGEPDPDSLRFLGEKAVNKVIEYIPSPTELLSIDTVSKVASVGVLVGAATYTWTELENAYYEGTEKLVSYRLRPASDVLDGILNLSGSVLRIAGVALPLFAAYQNDYDLYLIGGLLYLGYKNPQSRNLVALAVVTALTSYWYFLTGGTEEPLKKL